MEENENKKTTNNKEEEESQVTTDRPEWRDWTTTEGLMRRTGIKGNDNFISLIVKEITDNSADAHKSIDKDGKDKCELDLLKNGNGFYVQDYGKGIPGSDEHIANVFSAKRDSSSTKGIRLPTRGVLGIGLKYIAGFITIFKGVELRVSTCGRTLKLEPQKNNGTTRCEKIGDYNGPGTRIEITFKKGIFKPEMLDWGKKVIEMDRGEYYQGKSSPFWYDSESFYQMLQTTYTAQKKGDTVRSIIAKVFKEFSKKDLEGLDKKTKILFRRKAKSLDDEDSDYLLRTLRKKLKKDINPERLGCVGKELPGYEYYDKRCGTYNSGKAVLPYVLEVWGTRSNVVPVKAFYEIFYKTEINVFVNKSFVAGGGFSCERNSSNNEIWIIGCGLNIHIIEAKSFMNFRISIITPYIEKMSETKKPNLKPFDDEVFRLIAGIVEKANRDVKKEEREKRKNSALLNDLPNVIDEEILKQTHDKANELLEKIREQELSEKFVLSKDDDLLGIYFEEDAIKKAAWFKQYWRRLGYDDGYKNEVLHLRRIFYKMVSPEKGNKYKYLIGKKRVAVFGDGTSNCWVYLQKASKFARVLGMVDPARITDKRNPKIIPCDTGKQVKPEIEIIPGELQLPTIDVSSLKAKLELPNYQLNGYEYKNFLQPVHVVVFCEKSTIDDIILPLREKYGFTYVPSSGHSSFTHEAELVRIIKESNKLCVILYISDFDPSGESMPPSVSRNIEVLLYKEGIKNDRRVILKKIALTEKQVEDNDLPELPDTSDTGEDDKIKSKKNQHRNFKKNHNGHGPVELDALEALYPGELKKIIEDEISPYYDANLKDKIAKTKEQIKQNIDNLVEGENESYTKKLEPLERDIDGIAAEYVDRQKAMSDELVSKLAPYAKKMKDLMNEYENSMNEIKSKIKLPMLENLIEKKPFPSKDDPTIIFDSQRSHLEQLSYYPAKKQKKGKSDID